MNQSKSTPKREQGPVSAAVLELASLGGQWSWCAKVGIALIVFGVLALSLIAFNIDPVPWLSWLIVLSGLTEAVHAFHLRHSGAFFFHLVPGIASIPLGLLVATHPEVGIVPWMLVFASFFTIISLFRLVSAIRLRFPAWPWAAFDALVMLMLGSLFWTTWIWLGLRFFAIAVGVSLILRGWSTVMLGFALRRRHASPTLSHSRRMQRHSDPSVQTYRVEANH